MRIHLLIQIKFISLEMEQNKCSFNLIDQLEDDKNDAFDINLYQKLTLIIVDVEINDLDWISC